MNQQIRGVWGLAEAFLWWLYESSLASVPDTAVFVASRRAVTDLRTPT